MGQSAGVAAQRRACEPWAPRVEPALRRRMDASTSPWWAARAVDSPPHPWTRAPCPCATPRLGHGPSRPRACRSCLQQASWPRHALWPATASSTSWGTRASAKTREAAACRCPYCPPLQVVGIAAVNPPLAPNRGCPTAPTPPPSPPAAFYAAAPLASSRRGAAQPGTHLWQAGRRRHTARARREPRPGRPPPPRLQGRRARLLPGSSGEDWPDFAAGEPLLPVGTQLLRSDSFQGDFCKVRVLL
jgi:hypothetical protein